MTCALEYLMAAKRCEIADLQRLALTGALVNAVGRLVHGLQRERGLSNLFLASGGARWRGDWLQQVQASDELEQELRRTFEPLHQDAARLVQGARLFSRIASVLQGLDALPALRHRVGEQDLSPAQATEALIRMVAALLAVVFEAADGAGEPNISRHLVAQFHFMQGKEFAGQERATGSALFAAGRATTGAQQRLLHLIDSQERCLQVFQHFASPALEEAWQVMLAPYTVAQLERLRRVLCTTADAGALDAHCSQLWFDTCTERMDAMRSVEDQLAQTLLLLCQAQCDAATDELDALEQRVAASASKSTPVAQGDWSFFDTATRSPVVPVSAAAEPGLGLKLERSMAELVQEQAQRLQAMADELHGVRASLNERKQVERAKGVLMAHRAMNEEQAHKTLRQMAMNQNRRLVDVADNVLAMADMLPAR